MSINTQISVLVVDDYTTMFRIIQSMLKKLGFSDIDHAKDGGEALDMLGKKGYGLIVSDWNMAPMDGLELLKRVRANAATKTIPVIMVTAESRPENVIAAKEAGASDYILKPFSHEALKTKVTNALS